MVNPSALEFSVDRASLAFPSLRARVFARIKAHRRGRFATGSVWLKAIALLFILISSYAAMVLGGNSAGATFVLAVTFGVSTLAFALNVAHDAAHGSFSSSGLINTFALYLPFTILGVDAGMWRARHLNSHHRFPNVDRCDADIDENAFIRLSPNQPHRRWQRFQHFYAWVLYALVAFHATWIQDLNYMRRPHLANMADWPERTPSWTAFLFSKLLHVVIIYVIPLTLLPFGGGYVLVSLFVIQAVISLLFILPLIGTHFSTEAVFPDARDGKLEWSFVTHQIMTSVDWNSSSRMTCSLIGGLNAHAAHHLFPKVSHAHYAWISDQINAFCAECDFERRTVSLAHAIRGHYQFLKKLSVEEARP